MSNAIDYEENERKDCALRIQQAKLIGEAINMLNKENDLFHSSADSTYMSVLYMKLVIDVEYPLRYNKIIEFMEKIMETYKIPDNYKKEN